MRRPGANHLRHHGRFYGALLAGLAVAGATHGFDPGVRIALAGNAFFAIYLMLTGILARTLTVSDLRRKASVEDEGIVLIGFITLAAIALSLGSLAMLLAGQGTEGWRLVPAVANVPLGWSTLHTVMAFHYAHLFYARDAGAKGARRDTGGLDFPKTKEPTILDFAYYSFVVGMTAQVSDVDTTSQEMRRATTTHGIISFFFNTVILAFAVNVLTQG